MIKWKFSHFWEGTAATDTTQDTTNDTPRAWRIPVIVLNGATTISIVGRITIDGQSKILTAAVVFGTFTPTKYLTDTHLLYHVILPDKKFCLVSTSGSGNWSWKATVEEAYGTL